MRKIFLLLPLICTTALGASSAIQAPTVGYNLLNLTGINLLTGYNPDFELGNVSFWTASSGDTLSAETGANVLFNTTSGAYTASASGKFLVSQTVTVPLGLRNAGCYLGLYYTYSGTSGDYSVSIDDGTNALSSVISLPKATSARYVELNYPCGTTSNRLKLISNVASPSTIYLDNVYFGTVKNIGTAQQAVLIGGAVVTGCAGSWSTSSTSFAAYATQSGCSYATFGSAIAPSTNVPGIKFSSLPAGDYRIEYEGQLFQSTSAKSAYYQFTDGTITAKETSALWNGGSSIGSPTMNQTFSYSSAQSNVTLQVYAKTDSGGAANLYGTTGSPGTFKLWYFPSAAQQAVKVDQTPSSWSGYHTQAGATWSRTNTAYGDFTPTGTAAITQVNNINFGTVTTAASNLPGITFTPTKAGRYFICAFPKAYQNTSATYGDLQLTDGTTAFATGQINSTSTSTVPICGIYFASSVTSTTVKLQGKSSSGSINIIPGTSATSSIEWTISALDQGMAVPFLQGNVTSNTSGQERMERAGITNNGSTCAVGSQSGTWLSGCSRVSTGLVTLTIVAGEFTSAPICVCTHSTDTTNYADVCNISGSPTTTSVSVQIYNAQAQVARDDPFTIHCMGPR